MSIDTEVRTYNFFQDPGHGWLEVPVKELEELGIENEISSFSYYKDKKVYLEEDCDAHKFLKALEANNIKYSINEFHTDNDSPIRNFRHF